MALNALDWLVIFLVVAGTLTAALLFTRRAGSTLEDYFVSGRNLPWWLAGTSIVATTFACDTPLAITEMVWTHGIAANWFWWSIAGGHMLGVVLLARLWRRSRLVTDVSLIELRYHGRAATALQVFRAGYFGIVWNMITIGWVTAAMLRIFAAAVNTPLTGPQAHVELGPLVLDGPAVHASAVAALMGVAVLYSLFSGLWGVVVSDLIQFGIAMAGAVILAVYAVIQAGGMQAILNHPGLLRNNQLSMIPDLSRPWELPAAAFFVYVGLFWYTDKTADSGGYIAQRLLAAKNERHGTLAMLWFVIAHYCLRPWPWIIASLAAMVVFPPYISSSGAIFRILPPQAIDAYPKLIMTVLPAGLRGLLVGSLLAAFISTVNTQLNWGASYLTRDVYVRLWRPRAAQRELVWVGRIATFGLMVLGAVVSYYISSIEQAWKFLALLGAGSGLVLVGRWLWWRINAWSEIAVLATAFVCGLLLRVVLPPVGASLGWTRSWWVASFSTGLQPLFPLPFAAELPIVVLLSTAAWLTVTFLTRPAPMAKLREFYARTRPPGPGWRAVLADWPIELPRTQWQPGQPLEYAADQQTAREASGEVLARPPAPARGALPAVALAWALGVTFVFAALFGIGDLLLGRPWRGVGMMVLCAGAAVGFYYANRWAGGLLTPDDLREARDADGSPAHVQ